ncbi:MAG: TolC family protein, partial [Thermodesulfobacteriota bacterium]|nr:TolC family protein [Thermodesulfobacteriota bacterium]
MVKILSWLMVFYGYFFLISQNAQAQLLALNELETRISKEVIMGDLLSYAFQKNPGIQAAQEKWRVKVEQHRITTSYPDPQLMATYFPDPIETRLGPQDWNVNLSQMIPFPGKLSTAGDVVEADAKIARLNLDKTIRDVMVSIRESFYELYYIRKAKSVAHEQIKLLDHLRKAAETAYARDRATFMDVVKAQSQSGQLRYDLMLLNDLEQTESTRLNSLLNRMPDAPIGRLQDPVFPVMTINLEKIYRLAEENQEELRMADLHVEKADAQKDLAFFENLPNFKVGLSYSSIGDPDVPMPPRNAGDDAVGVQFGITIPLWFNKNKGRMGRARAELRAARAAKSVQVNETRAKIRAMYFRLENARRIMTLYKEDLLPQAAKAMETAETWFQEGESSFSDFVETQSVWYNFQLALARAQAD